MQFYNLSNKQETLGFKEGVLKGAGSGKGLFFPVYVPKLKETFFKEIDTLSLPDMAVEILKEYVGDSFPKAEFEDLCHAAFNFPIPLVNVKDNIFALELFHGPSLAFKDVGARFLSEVLRKIANESGEKITVLVATSGDTGSAVAKSFYNVSGVNVVLLYPSGKVSTLQEKTLTTMDKNIHTLEIEGAFDDCQRLVKNAFADDQLAGKMKLTSANSINIGRFLPQTVYYFWAWKQLDKKLRDNLLVSVPSGNYGNLTAGALAQKMGLPVKQFVASSNVNKVVPDYLQTGSYEPREAIQTLSNAMDVGDPSNFIRLKTIYNNQHKTIQNSIKSRIATDEETIQTIRELYNGCNYLADPHGAIGYLGCKDYVKEYSAGIFMETAHPAKFKDTVEKAIDGEVQIPAYLKKIQKQKKQAVKLSANYEKFKQWLLAFDWK
jgi:threonine synthase